MRFGDFETLIHRLAAEVPPEFLEGIAGIEVLPKVVPHPERAGIYTLGECVPLPVEGGRDGELESRVLLYHGSFQALAQRQPDFDWRGEAWETLTHELRHHLEWRARVPDLEAFDWAAEQNFARMDGAPFDPDFPLSAERAGDGVYRLDDDYFLDRPVGVLPAAVAFGWHGTAYAADVPAGAHLPAFLTVTGGVTEPPPGDLILYLRRPARLLDLFRRRAPPFLGEVRARAAPGPDGLFSPGGS